jgi:hypothetical protein
MKLETSVELLERVRAAQGVSWWKLPGVLEASESTVKNWKRGRTTIDRKFATKIADILHEPPEYVLACLEYEREPSADVKKIWQRIAAKFRSHAASILLGAVVLVGLEKPISAEAHAPVAEGDRPAMYIMSNRRRKLIRWLKKKNGWPLPLEWIWARTRSTGSPLSSSSLSPVPT